RLISLGDRIVDCFLRSQNATGRISLEPDGHVPEDLAAALPAPTSREVLAISAYLTWLSSGTVVGNSPGWRGQNVIPQAALLPMAALDRGKGEAIFAERCT